LEVECEIDQKNGGGKKRPAKNVGGAWPTNPRLRTVTVSSHFFEQRDLSYDDTVIWLERPMKEWRGEVVQMIKDQVV